MDLYNNDEKVLFDLTNTIYREADGNYYFCGDDLYGHYTKDELIQLRSAIWHRITEVLK